MTISDDPTDAPEGYAAALAELETILDELETDDLDVDVLAARVARAAALVRFCRARIENAKPRCRPSSPTSTPAIRPNRHWVEFLKPQPAMPMMHACSFPPSPSL